MSKKVNNSSKIKIFTQVGVDGNNGETLFEAGNSADHPLIARIGVQDNLNIYDEFKSRRLLQLFTFDESEATGVSDNQLVKGVGQQKNLTWKESYIHISMQVFMPTSQTCHFPPSRQNKCKKAIK
jgi:hypothetical protein